MIRATYSSPKFHIGPLFPSHQSTYLVHKPAKRLPFKWSGHQIIQAASFQLSQKIATYCSRKRTTNLVIYLLIRANKTFAQTQRTDLPDNGLRFFPPDAVKTVAGTEPLKPSILDETDSRRIIFLAIGFSIVFSFIVISVVVLVCMSRRRKRKDKEILRRATWQVTLPEDYKEKLPVKKNIKTDEEAPVPDSDFTRLRDSTFTGKQRLLRQKDTADTSDPDSNADFYFASSRPVTQDSEKQVESVVSEPIYATRRARSSWFTQTRLSQLPASLPAPIPPPAAKLPPEPSHSDPAASTSHAPLIQASEAIHQPQPNPSLARSAPEPSHLNPTASTILPPLARIPEATPPTNSNPPAITLASASSHLNPKAPTLLQPVIHAPAAIPPLHSNPPAAKLAPQLSQSAPTVSTLMPPLLEVPEALSPFNFDIGSRNSSMPPTRTSTG